MKDESIESIIDDIKISRERVKYTKILRERVKYTQALSSLDLFDKEYIIEKILRIPVNEQRNNRYNR